MFVDHNVFNGPGITALNAGYYNINYAVGPARNTPNRRDDVLQVQYLLKTIAATNDAFWAEGWKPSGVVQAFSVDGVMGAITGAWIKSYQAAVNKKFPRMILEDNRVDPARGAESSVSKTTYTILALDSDLAWVQRAKFARLEDAADAPAELRQVIRTTRAQNIISVWGKAPDAKP